MAIPPSVQTASGAVEAIPVQIYTSAGAPVDAFGGAGSTPYVPPSGVGADHSGSAPVALSTLATITVANPGCYYIQNQSANQLQVIYSDGAGGVPSTQLLAPGSGANKQGADTAPPMAWFKGQIIIAGPAGSQFMARSF